MTYREVCERIQSHVGSPLFEEEDMRLLRRVWARDLALAGLFGIFIAAFLR